MKNLDKEIEHHYNQKLLRKKMEVHLLEVQKRLKERYKEQKKLELVLDKEAYDLEQLEKLSISGLFFKLLGNKEEQMERKRQSYLLTFLKHNDCVKRIDAKIYEIKILQEKLKSFPNPDKHLKKMLTEKRNHIKFRNKTAAQKIIKQEQNIYSIQRKQKEIKEAINAGKKVIPALKKLNNSLSQMKNWRMNYQGEIHSNTLLFKQKRFAKKKINELTTLNRLLDKFTDELNDLTKQYALDYSSFIQRISTFLEQLYDGLISDWIFHKNLKVSINTSVEATDKVNRIIEMLKIDNEAAILEAKEEKNVLESLVLISSIKPDDT